MTSITHTDGPPRGIDTLVEAVLGSRKYRHVCTELIRDVGARQLEAQPNVKSAIKATKNKLHQIGSAYMPGQARYDSWLEELKAAATPADREIVCERIMAYHASSRERLPALQQIYTQLSELMPAPQSVMDIACGFNPLAVPWMTLAPATTYYVYDIYNDLIDFLCAALPLLGIHAQGAALDVTQSIPQQRVDLVLLMKAIPCLEQLDRTAGRRLLDQAPAERILVTFPVHSLGGHAKGMEATYARHLKELVQRPGWQATELDVPGELAYLVERPWAPQSI